MCRCSRTDPATQGRVAVRVATAARAARAAADRAQEEPRGADGVAHGAAQGGLLARLGSSLPGGSDL